jgi:hypothetical protein
MPTGGQGLTRAENVGRGFILRSTLPAERAISQPHQMEMSIQGIMPCKKYSNHPGLFPTEGQEFGPSAPRSTPESVVGKDQGLGTLPPSCADCLKIWEPQPPGTFRACQGL